MVESASKGLILMYSKETLLKVFERAHVSPGAEFYFCLFEREGRERRKGRESGEREEEKAKKEEQRERDRGRGGGKNRFFLFFSLVCARTHTNNTPKRK